MDATFDLRQPVTQGGFDAGGNALGDGASYDPVTDQWKPMASVGAPSPRAGNVSVWTGERWVIWGGGTSQPNATEWGWAGLDLLSDGAAYDPVGDKWHALPASGAPTARARAGNTWAGSKVLIFGGYQPTEQWASDGASYDPVADAWCPLSAAGAPTLSRDQMVWVGDRAFTWYDGAWTFLP